MTYDDRSVKPMSASLMRARIATRVLAGMYEEAPALLTSAVRLSVELPGATRPSGPPFPFTFAVSPAWCSGLEGARLVGTGKLDIAWINPSIITTMAHLGKGPFRRPYPLRALAIFPSWDRLVVAVAGRLGIRSMDELIKKRPALNASVATNDCVDFAIAAMLKAHGLKLDSWGDLAAKHGFVFLPFSKKALAKLERYGFRRAPLGGGRLQGNFDPATEVIDYSGWPIVTHENFPAELAYHFVAALENIREEIPYDAPEVPPMSSFCRSTEEGPLDIPLHPGAKRYYREKGYLRWKAESVPFIGLS